MLALHRNEGSHDGAHTQMVTSPPKTPRSSGAPMFSSTSSAKVPLHKAGNAFVLLRCSGLQLRGSIYFIVESLFCLWR